MRKERITEAVRSIKPLVFLVAFVFPTLAMAAHITPIRRDSLRRVTFSGDCSVRQDAEMRDGRLELMMAATGDRACVVTLEMNSPVLLASGASLQFTARGTRPRQYIRFEFGRSADDDVNLLQSPSFEVGNDWQEDAMRFSRLKGGKEANQLATIRILALPNNHAAIQPAIALRGLGFVSLTLHQAAPSPQVMPKTMAMPAVTPTIVVPPLTKDLRQGQWTASGLNLWREWHRKAAIYRSRAWRISRWGLLSLWGFLGLGVVLRRKPQAAQLFSPLFEMNARMWKSARDQDGVLHVGGFNRVTTAELKAIKASGFNSLWLMGIWEIGPKVRAISRRYGEDFAGSPFAISDYRVSEELGTEQEFQDLIDRAHTAGLLVIVDFVPNHMGLDTVWLNEHPEYFIHRVLDFAEEKLPDGELETRYPGHFVYRTPSYPQDGQRVPKTIMVAYGKDPYFYPWIDTAQLDYADPGLRRKMIGVLSQLSRRVDGVRCDMAMLVLREQVKVHRHPDMSWETFNRWMPEEFWSEAIRVVKRVNPRFAFMAETYWSMEGYLQHLGFDYTYNKPLYEAICNAFHNGNAEGLMNFVRMLGTEFLQKGVHFIENHDEERAMNALGEERQRAAAAMLCTLPGITLIHQGQMEGHRERMPVQRIVPLHIEPQNAMLTHFYRKLLHATALPVFREGRLHVLYSNNSSFAAYARVLDDQKTLVIINTSTQYQKGFVHLMPGLRLKTGAPYKLHDLFYELKPAEVKRQVTVQPSYTYAASHLINQGLYVELHPFDAHIFMVEPRESFAMKEYLRDTLREINDQLPLPRVARRILGPALMRSEESSSNPS